MKTWAVVVGSVVLGTALGIGTAAFRIAWAPWDGTPEGAKPGVPQPATPVAGESLASPQVEVREETYDFGQMENLDQQSHDFVFSNRGTAPLSLTKGETSCKCTVLNLDKMEIPPGETAAIKIQWTGKNFKGPYRQTANILTNDPNKPRVVLTITGRIAATIETSPAEVVMSAVTAGESATQLVKLYSFKPGELKVEGYGFSDPELAKFTEVQATPMTAKDLAQSPEAKSGYLLEIRVKPGLPLGPFQQTISVKTNLRPSPNIVIPMKGTVVSDIAIVGRGWSEETGTLALGSATVDEGISRTVVLVVRGPFVKQVHFDTLKVEPGLIQVELGPTTPSKSGSVTQTPLTIRVPPRTNPIDYMTTDPAKMALITLATHHPRAPQLQIHVRFVVRN